MTKWFPLQSKYKPPYWVVCMFKGLFSLYMLSSPQLLELCECFRHDVNGDSDMAVQDKPKLLDLFLKLLLEFPWFFSKSF